MAFKCKKVPVKLIFFSYDMLLLKIYLVVFLLQLFLVLLKFRCHWLLQAEIEFHLEQKSFAFYFCIFVFVC